MLAHSHLIMKYVQATYAYYFLSQNAVLCLIFGLALLAGAIVNAHYSSDNLDVYDDSDCSEYDGDNNNYNNNFNSVVKEICGDLETLFITEGAAAVSFDSYNSIS